MNTAHKTRTRFAPSPTGHLHVGGVRTLLFAYLLAKHDNGKFLLRIEDTDRDRLVLDAVEAIVSDMKWLGVLPDEGPTPEELRSAGYQWDSSVALGGDAGPYIQSLRKARYAEVAEQLIAGGFAYRCDCTAERLDQERQEQAAQGKSTGYSGYCRNRNVSKDARHVVRFRIEEGRGISLPDAVKGTVTWDAIVLKDSVILKSDGYPTYHLACVVDDHDMDISHVLRGDEWLSTAPLHLLIYEALGWTAPVFAHLPPVLGSDGKKLSKRHGATFVSSFREAGYLPEALRNFLALYGWAPPGDRETDIIPLEEMIQKFTLDRVENSGGIFSYEKLDWMNGMYIRSLTPADLAARLTPFLELAGLTVDQAKLEQIVPHIQQRLTKLTDAAAFVDFLFLEHLDREMKKLPDTPEKTAEVLKASREAIANVSDFNDPKAIEQSLKEVCEKLSVGAKHVFLPVRIAVTGKMVTPPLFESISVVGRELSLKRIDETIASLVSR